MTATHPRDYTRLASAIVIAALVVAAGVLASSYLGTATTETRTSTSISTYTSIATTTSIQTTLVQSTTTLVQTSTTTSNQVLTSTFTTTTTRTVVSVTNSSIPGFVEVNGVIWSEIYMPTVVKFLQDECTNAPYNTICDPCLNATTAPVPAAAASRVAVPVACLQNLYSANITITGTQPMGSNASQVDYYGSFSISVPNGFGYQIIPWLATSSHPGGQGLYAGYFLVDTPSSSINEPGVECYFPNFNYSLSNDACQTFLSASHPPA